MLVSQINELKIEFDQTDSNLVQFIKLYNHAQSKKLTLINKVYEEYTKYYALFLRLYTALLDSNDQDQDKLNSFNLRKIITSYNKVGLPEQYISKSIQKDCIDDVLIWLNMNEKSCSESIKLLNGLKDQLDRIKKIVFDEKADQDKKNLLI